MWAILELMGHVRLAGKLSEEERFGAKVGRIDIPKPPSEDCPVCNGTGAYKDEACLSCDQFLTQFFGGGSVYRITPVSEQVARDVARKISAAPVSPWDYPKPALPAPAVVADDDDDLDDDGNGPCPPF